MIRSALLLLSLILFTFGCASLKESWTGPKYKAIYSPNDGKGRQTGPVEVILTADRTVMVSPGVVRFTARILGDISDCAWVSWYVYGSDGSGRSDCVRAESRAYLVKCWGECTALVAVYAAGQKPIAVGTLTLHIGDAD